MELILEIVIVVAGAIVSYHFSNITDNNVFAAAFFGGYITSAVGRFAKALYDLKKK